MKKIFLISAFFVTAFVVMGLVGNALTNKKVDEYKSELKTKTSTFQETKFHFDELKSLPIPVARYFRYALKDAQPLIVYSYFHQSGIIRTSMESNNWMPFSATQMVSPFSPGFIWDAKVFLLTKILHIRVLDSYMQGEGSGQVKIFSTITIGEDKNKPELNSGALHRYLAEAPWTPTSLLPQSGVRWTPIDANRALAVFTDKKISVSLEFRFNEKGEITGIFSPGRWGTFDGVYKQVGWEGHFSDYRSVQGMRIPFKGEVGWYDKGKWKAVWKGNVDKAEYKF